MKHYNNEIYQIGVFLLLMPLQAFSAEDSVLPVIKSDPMSASYLFQLILGLIIVLICIVVLAWFAKRVNRLQSSTGGLLTILGGISMGSRERVVLMQVGEQQLLIGVAPGRINTLYVLDTPVENADNNPGKTFADSFSEKLKSMVTEGNK